MTADTVHDTGSVEASLAAYGPTGRGDIGTDRWRKRQGRAERRRTRQPAQTSHLHVIAFGAVPKQSRPSPLVAAVLLAGCAAAADLPPGVGRSAQPAPTASSDAPSIPKADGKRVARAYDRACVLDSNGAALCWGLQLATSPGGDKGADSYAMQLAPARVEGLPPLVDLALAGQRSCGVDRSRYLWCWGDVPYYARNWPVLAKPTRFPDLEGVQEVSLANDHGCVLLESGAIACFGEDSGLGPRADKTPERPQQVAAFAPAAQVVTADDLTCARGRDGKVECIGKRICGTPAGHDPSQVYRPFEDVEVERLHADRDALCGVTRAGRVACVPCATPLTPDSRKPKKVEGPWATLRDVTDVSADARRGCALHTDGRLSCWGYFVKSTWNQPHYVGDWPLTTPSLSPVVALDLNHQGACATTPSGQVACWGYNRKGELGVGTEPWLATPGRPLGEGVVALATSSDSTCALGSDKRVRCYGACAPRGTDGLVQGVSDVTALFGGDKEICALSGATLTCLAGQAVERIPVAEPPIHVASDYHIRCLLDRSGRVACNPRTNADSLDPHHQLLQAQRGVTALALGPMHACFTLRDGAVRCAGENQDGALGRPGDTEGVVVVPGPREVVALDAGESMTCALEKRGAVWCWGADRHLRAALGDKPQKLLDHARGLSVGESHACAVDDKRGLVCWGSDLKGQLGDDTALAFKTAPAPVRGLREVTAVAVSELHSCAVERSGALSCWGSNAEGQLGATTARGFYEEPVFVLGRDPGPGAASP